MLIETSASRLVARRLIPSINMPMICVRFSLVSVFILNIMLDELSLVKHKIQFDGKYFQA